MRLLSSGRTSFALSLLCGLFAWFCISPRGAQCGSAWSCRPPPRPTAPVQDLVHRAGVVFEGKLQEELQSDMNARERDALLTGAEPLLVDPLTEGPNGTAEPESRRVRVRVHQVWEIKAGGLEKDSVVSLIWFKEDNCFSLSAGTRYVFFMDPTNDTSVFKAVSPPVETKRAVKKDVNRVLCQTCAPPKLKQPRNITVQEGQKTKLKCELLGGNKQTTIKWYRNEKEIGTDKTRNIRIKRRGPLSELQLMKATEADGGKYTCKAVNKLGEDSWETTVNVIKTPPPLKPIASPITPSCSKETLPDIRKSATSTTPSAKTSSHVTRCSEKEKNFCVNGGECFKLEVTSNSIKQLCRCPPGYTGNRCQNTDPVRVVDPKQHHGIEFMEAEELYQKRVLTITGICIALLVVGIMCVVAYCKTKKQRKKLHDRLRQSLRERNDMACMANGPHYPQNLHPPPENLHLVNQYVLKNAVPAQHVIEKETETSFSTSQYTSSTQPSTAVTHTSSQCWSNGKMEGVISDSRAALVLSTQNSRNGTPSHRGRLNATGGTRDLDSSLKNSREMTDSYRDSPYSERYVSTMTTPSRLSPVKLLSPATPSSPPSEMSAPLSSLATSVPSMATSPSGEEDRPLLFLTPPRLRDKPDAAKALEPSRAQQIRCSAHYNHGLEEASPPASPLHIVEDEKHESTQEHHGSPASDLQSPTAGCNSPQTAKSETPADQEAAGRESSESSSSSSESETEDERVGEDTPFLSIQNPAVSGVAVLSLEVQDSSRTNPALRLSPQDDLQTRLASVMANQDPIAV